MPSTASHHPLPLRQRAFTLYCQGHRSPAIAARLNVPERTIRAWLQADLRQLAQQATPTRRELLQLAITRQLAIASAAWDAYTRLTSTEPSVEEAPIPHHEPSSSPPLWERPGEGPRYLRLAHAAYREIDRLQGLYLPAPAEPQAVRIILERLPNDDTDLTITDLTDGLPTGLQPVAPIQPPQPVAPTDSPAETATSPTLHHAATSSLHRNGERPGEGSPASAAETATPSHPLSAQADIVGDGPSGAVSTASSPTSPAETATATPPPPRVGEGAGGEVGGLWPGYGPHDILPRHIADALGLPRFRERNRRPAPPPLFAYRL